MLSTIKNDPDWEGQIEIKYENIIPEYIDIKEIKYEYVIPEYIDVKEIKEESADYQEFEKIEKCSINEDLEDLPQGNITDDKDLNGGDHEIFDCSYNKCSSSSIGILGTKDSLEWQCSEYNYDNVINMENHKVVTHNSENESSSTYQNVPSFDLVSHTGNKSEITLITNINRKCNKCEHCDYISCSKGHINSKHTRGKLYNCECCDYGSPHMSNLKRHMNSTHTRKKIHKCQYCNYENPQISNLKRHITSMHKREDIHKCTSCDYVSPQMSNLKLHMNSKHPREKIHKCEIVGSPELSNLKCHSNSMHIQKSVSKRGKVFLIVNNFKFNFADKLTSGEVKWRCRVPKCKAALYTVGEENAISKCNLTHCHSELSAGELQKQFVAVSAKLKASEDIGLQPKRVLQSALKDNETDSLTVKDLHSVKRSIYGVRRRFPTLPKT